MKNVKKCTRDVIQNKARLSEYVEFASLIIQESSFFIVCVSFVR